MRLIRFDELIVNLVINYRHLKIPTVFHIVDTVGSKYFLIFRCRSARSFNEEDSDKDVL